MPTITTATSKKSKDTIQISMRFPSNWIVYLKKLANIKSLKTNKDYLFTDLIREAVQHTYLKGNKHNKLEEELSNE